MDGWLRAVPDSFRFVVKAQRGGSFRAWQAAATDSPPLDWLTGPYRRFGGALGAVLVRIPESVRREDERDDERLGRLLAAWPPDLPLAMEFQDRSWEVDEVLGALRGAGAAWVVTELDGLERPPSIHVTGGFLYLRLRCEAYDAPGVDAWADRLVPFLESGLDAFAFFRHDDVGRGPEFALALEAAVVQRVRQGSG